MDDFGLLDCLKVFRSMARWSGVKVNSFPSTDTMVDLPDRMSQSTDFDWIDIRNIDSLPLRELSLHLPELFLCHFADGFLNAT